MARGLRLLPVLLLVLACCGARAAAESTATPTTESPTTATPTTESLTTATPTTESPTTETPNTESPTTATPTTESLTTETPNTESPTTETPNTESPTTKPPTTESLTTETPNTESPTTETPNTESPTTETPNTESPTTETPNTEPPTTKPPTTDAPATETPKPPNACDGNPCGDGSTCEPRANGSFVCLCFPGDFYNYNTSVCERSKVFPGQMSVPGIDYKPEMENPISPAFQDAAKKIVDDLSKAFTDNKDYSGSTVLKLEPIASRKVWSRMDGVSATVDIAFRANSNVNSATVQEGIKNYAEECKDCTLANSSFKEGNLCDKKPCDPGSTKCSPTEGFYVCDCLAGYIKTSFSTNLCVACPSGQKAVGTDKCEDCPFGYAGLNCEDPFKLVLIIVGSVLGGLLLITLVLMSVMAVKSKKKSAKAEKSLDMGHNHSSDKAPLVNSSLASVKTPSANGSALAMPRIPRVAPANSWDRGNNLEMTQSNNRQNLVPSGRSSRFDDDDVSPYAPARPMTNPYAQSRPQVNPYASNQGMSNPYYRHDDGRRFN